MARPTLFHHRKFRKLARLVGSRALAVGSLELLWAVANDAGDPLIGPVDDVEDVADWKGEPGALASALVASGFLDETPDGLVVHDHEHHAPAYVQRRREREKSRESKGLTLSDVRRHAAEVRWNNKQVDATESQVHANGATPNTQHPSPNTQHPDTRAREVPGEMPVTHAPIAGSLPAHRRHAVCGRVCLHTTLFEEFTRLSGQPPDQADGYVRTWAMGVLASWPEGQPIGDDTWAFWRLRWSEAHASTKKARAVQAIAPTERSWTCPHTPACTSRWQCARKDALAGVTGDSA